MDTKPDRSDAQHVEVRPWPSEEPLFIAILALSILLWVTAIVGTAGLGLLYILIIGCFFFFVHAALIAHIRGSAIKLGPDQFPELHRRVVELSERAGIHRTPDAYIMQADGVLNAFATSFFRGRFIVLYSDLLDACGGDDAARDMIIGHELGHLRANHLRWRMLTLPGRLIPFLGSAYSRACEYTCDRWGSALSGDQEGARRGLLVLAAGGKHYGRVNEAAFIRQQDDLNTGWMTLSRWLGTYPPISARVQAIGPDFGSTYPSRRGALRAWAIMAFLVAGPILLISILLTIGHFLTEGSFENELFGTSTPAEMDLPALGNPPRFASVEDMPAPSPVPPVLVGEHMSLGTSCFDGDMAACDDLYYNSPMSSPAETYGNSCGGRFPNNRDMDCKDLVRE